MRSEFRWLAIVTIILAASATLWLARDASPPQPTVQRPSVPAAPAVAVRITDSAAFDRQLASARTMVLIDFNSVACAPCALLSPVLENYARSHPDVVLVLSVDVVKLPELAARYQVEDLPLVVRLDHGAESARFTGVKSTSELVAWLTQTRRER